MIENLRLSFRGILSHKMRSALTMLGIIIGIMAIIIIVSLINGASEQLKSSFIGSSTTIELTPYAAQSNYDFFSPEYSAAESGPLEGVGEIPDEALKMVKDIPGVSDAAKAYMMNYSAQVSYLGQSSSTTAYGVDTEYFKMADYRVISGRLINENDLKQHNNVIVFDNQFSNIIFRNTDPLGKTVQLGSELFTVVGIVAKPLDESKINNMEDYEMQMGYTSPVFVPMTSWNDLQGYDDIQILTLKISDPDLMIAATNEAADILDSLIDSSVITYKSSMLQDMADSLQETVQMTSLLLGGIASISLLVGGIGIMNIMLVSVTERTREIGLKKALGARRRVILGQFLTESVVLSGLGGIIGVLLGIGIAKLIAAFVMMPAPISVSSIVVSVSFSMGIGIIFGIVPSVKAAKLDPIDALRYE